MCELSKCADVRMKKMLPFSFAHSRIRTLLTNIKVFTLTFPRAVPLHSSPLCLSCLYAKGKGYLKHPGQTDRDVLNLSIAVHSTQYSVP
jgi:hypothetical protein